MSLSAAACKGAALPSWTGPPPAASDAGPPASSQPTSVPAGSPGPTPDDLRPDPNAPFYVVRDPRAPDRLAGTVHAIDLLIDERHVTVAEGLVREVWAFGENVDGVTGVAAVPGPVIRVGVGDTILVHLSNNPPKLPGWAAVMHPAVNNLSHSVTVNGSIAGSNGAVVSIKPAKDRIYEFTAQHAGVWMYACLTDPALEHLANGQYGMLIVEPEGGLDAVDQEFFLVQGEWYLGGPGQPASLTKAAAPVPVPDFVVLNGVAGQYRDHPIRVETGARVRVFILDAGPNLDSAFRVEGATFDRVARDGIELTAGGEEGWGGRAVNLSPGQGAIVEFTLAEDGLYPIVNDAYSVDGSGILGLFQAGDGDPLN